MSNVLSEQAKQQVIALGRLGWSLRRIQQEAGIRRETASVYLKAAGIPIAPPGRRRQQSAKPAISVTTGSRGELPPPNSNLPNKGTTKSAKPANQVTTGFGVELSGLGSQNPTPTASACEPFREAIELGLSRGRNAMAIWQDLVADTGFNGSYTRNPTCAGTRCDCYCARRRSASRLRKQGPHGPRPQDGKISSYPAVRHDSGL
jgi:hypothetical protein